MISFRIPSAAAPQPRPRFTTAGGFPRAYTKKTDPVVGFKLAVQAAALAAGVRPVSYPLELLITAVYVRPKSHRTARGVIKPSAPAIPPRGDGDNLLKPIADALHGIAYGNDSYIGVWRIEKHYGPIAETLVTLRRYVPPAEF
jgi:Holliday junction resolvase RusA-like endonuclease